MCGLCKAICTSFITDFCASGSLLKLMPYRLQSIDIVCNTPYCSLAAAIGHVLDVFWCIYTKDMKYTCTICAYAYHAAQAAAKVNAQIAPIIKLWGTRPLYIYWCDSKIQLRPVSKASMNRFCPYLCDAFAATIPMPLFIRAIHSNPSTSIIIKYPKHNARVKTVLALAYHTQFLRNNTE